MEIRVPAACRLTLDTDGSQLTISIAMTIDMTECHSRGRELEHSGKISALESNPTMNSTTPDCDRYWDHADWLPPWYILDRWCQQDAPCRQAKYEALLTACEHGDVKYDRRDGKNFDDPIRELAQRRILIIERASFNAWAAGLDGQSPLAVPPGPTAPFMPTPPWVIPAHTPEGSTSALANTQNHQALDDTPEQEIACDERNEPASTTSGSPNLTPPAGDVTTDEIIAAFPVVADEKANIEWWKTRMREAKDYGLTEARTYAGRLRVQSRWQPHIIAFWLVDKGHMNAKVVKRIISRNFPDWADAVEYFIDG